VTRHSLTPLVAAFAVLAAVSLTTALSGCGASGPSGPVTPVVDSAAVDADGYLQASGHVDGIAESGGKCKFTFWAENGEASRLVSTGKIDGNRTLCPDVEEHATMVAPGTYSLTLSYQPKGQVPGGDEPESEKFELEISE
jgi:hypothetical protein